MPQDLQKKIRAILNTAPVLHPPEISAEVYGKFCQIFLESVPKIIESLREQRAGDAGIQKLAHKLKGACGFAGAIRLGQLAAELEQIADAVSGHELDFFHNTLGEVLAETRAAMRNGQGAAD